MLLYLALSFGFHFFNLFYKPTKKKLWQNVLPVKSWARKSLKEKLVFLVQEEVFCIFLLNTLLTIKRFRDDLCCCNRKEQKCAICEIRNEFYSVEYSTITCLILIF